MEAATLPYPFGTVQHLSPPLRTICPKVSFVKKDSTQYSFGFLAKRNVFRQPYPVFISATVTCRRKHDHFLWRLFTATLEGMNAVEESMAETRLEENITQEIQVPKRNDTNVSLVVDTTKELQATQKTRIDTSRHEKSFKVSVDSLIPGAIFTGKVTNIQKYGAFVDIGTFTSGLIHISNLSKSFVKAIEDVVQVGQEVKVQIVAVNLKEKRISLKLKTEEEDKKEEQVKQPEEVFESNVRQSSVTKRGNRAKPNVTGTKPQKGEILNGVIKNIIKSGAFVTLPRGYEGYLPASEMNDVTVLPESQFKLGQEVTVRVLRTDRDRIRLTMKKKVDIVKFNESLNKDSVRATNPFEIAFRQNKEIARYLEQKQIIQDVMEGNM